MAEYLAKKMNIPGLRQIKTGNETKNKNKMSNNDTDKIMNVTKKQTAGCFGP